MKKPVSIILVLLLASSMALGGCKKEEAVSQTTTPTPAAQENAEATPEVTVTQAPKDEVVYPMQMGVSEIQQKDIYSEDFEDGQTDFTGRGSASASIVSDKFYEGAKSLFVTERTATWNGTSVDLTSSFVAGQNYKVSAYVMYENGPDSMQIDCKVEKNSSEYLSFASTSAKKGEWTKIEGGIIIPTGTTQALVYFETAYGDTNVDFIDFYVDSFTIIQEQVTAERGELPALKEVFKDYFSVGVAATRNEILGERKDLIVEQFNSFTTGNEMKPDSLLDYQACVSDPKYDDNPAVKFTYAEPLLRFASENGLKMRGHTLVWHSQTPRWFFTVGYSKDINAPLVSKELMLKRMENYIKNVLEYTQTNYPGLIYCWDVVNEAINDGDGEEGGYRSSDSLWYQVIGPEFVEKAFEYSRKYADPEVKLFYNDFNTEDRMKMASIIKLAKGLKAKNLIDGIGLQTHISIDGPSLMDMEESMRNYGELGLEIQITELDMGMTVNTEEDYLRQAKRYKRLFNLYKAMDQKGTVNITNVTFWGLSDDISWLSKPGVPSYPLLFDSHLMQKPAFWGVVGSSDIPLY